MRGGFFLRKITRSPYTFVVILGLIGFSAYGFGYLPTKAREHDEAAQKDLRRLAHSLKCLCAEVREHKGECPPLPPWFEEQYFLFFKGPYYGWNGTDGEADVRVRMRNGEIQACARNGSSPGGGKTRWIYRHGVLGDELPPVVGECRGYTYAGDLCFTESIVDPKDGSFRFGPKPDQAWTERCEKTRANMDDKRVAQIRPQVDGINELGMSLCRRLGSANANLVISPYGLSEVLGLLYEGAGGSTKIELANVLNIKDPKAPIHDSLASLRRAMACEASRGGGILDIQNSIALQGRGDFDPRYLDIVERSFEARTSDSSSPERLTLLNLIVFNNTWQSRFDPSRTEDLSFYLLNGTGIKVPTMSQFDNKVARYMETDHFEALEMCYEGAKLSMVVFLPKAKNGLPEFERSLTTDKLNQWLAELEGWEWGIHIYMPRFSITMSHELDRQLKAIGLKSAYERDAADFTGMATWAKTAPIWVDRIQQKIMLDVNEKGTTAIALSMSCLNIASDEFRRRKKGQPIVFNADHPFMFIVRHNPTGCVLFMGRVMNPDQ